MARKKYNKSTGRKYGKGSYEKSYQARPEQRRNRSNRNKARRKMAKRVGKSALKGKDVGHKRPLSKGGTNSMSNLKISSPSKNRGRTGEGNRKKGKRKKKR